MAKTGSQGKAVLAALEAGRVMRRMGEDWRCGTLVATKAMVADLVRQGVVRIDGDVLDVARPGGANRLLVDRRLDGAGRRVTVNLAESPLGWLKSRGMVSERQFAAGECLRADWTAASLAPRVTMRWDASPSSRTARGPGGAMDPTLMQISTKQRFEAAVAAIGAGLGDIAWRVICAGEGLETAERALAWPKRAGRVILLLALDRLADHYHI